MPSTRPRIRPLVAIVCGAALATVIVTDCRGDATPGISLRRNSSPPPKCILISVSLCRAVRDRSTFALAMTQSAVLISDGITTRESITRGYVEIDPLTRVLIGRRPTWGRMAPLGVVQVFAETWMSQRMKNSQHPLLRRLWWMPLVFGIIGNSAGTIDNLTLSRR